jgi:cell wall-associated NlpC family hydrolase
MMTLDPKRKEIVDEAISWLRTPYHHEARVKRSGVDCGMLLAEVFERVGLIPHIDPSHYPPDFMMHRADEWYLSIISTYCHEIEGDPLPGDVMLFKVGRLYAHGGIVIDWPMIIHASIQDKVVAWGDANLNPLAARQKRFFRHNYFLG